MSEISDIYEKYLQHPNIQTDTRKLQQGDFFFALKGPNFNANKFALKALDNGAAIALVDDWALSQKSDKLIYVDNVLECLQQLARFHRLKFNIPVIAITGSNGKTTTKELLHTVLSKKHQTSATIGNLNNHIGVPLTLLKVKQDTEISLVEMGANHQKEIAFYCDITLPNYGLITNVGKAHLEGFGGLEGVRKGKGELYDFIRKTKGSIFRNADLDYLTEMAHDIPEQYTYGQSNAKIIGRSLQNNHFLKIALLSTGLETEIRTQLAGNYNFANVLAAVAVGHYFNVPVDDIKTAIESYNPDNSRSQWLQIGTNQIILDAYNANPSSMKMAIQNMAQTKANNKYLILGSMKELGEYSSNEHQEIVDLALKSGLKQLLLCGPEFEKTQRQGHWFINANELLAWLYEHPIKNSLILIKGSRSIGMEAILPAFQGLDNNEKNAQ